MARQKQTKIDSITKALILVAHGSTITEASQECNIARSTLSKAINQDSEIQELLNRNREHYQAEVIEDIGAKTKRIFDKALDTIDQALTDPATASKEKNYIALSYIGKIANALARQAEAQQKKEDKENELAPIKIITTFSDNVHEAPTLAELEEQQRLDPNNEHPTAVDDNGVVVKLPYNGR